MLGARKKFIKVLGFSLIAFSFVLPSESQARFRWKLSDKQKTIVKQIISDRPSKGWSPRRGLAQATESLRMLRYYHPGKFGRGIGPVMGSLDEVGNEVARRLGLSFEPVTDLRGVSGAGSKNLYNQIAAGPRGLRSGYFTPLAVERDGGFKINPIAIKYFEEELGIYKRMAEFGGPKVYGIGNDGRNLSGLIIEHIEKVPCTDAEMAEALARFADDALDRGSIAADLRPDNVVMTKHGLRPIDVDFVPVGIKRSQLTGGQELKLDNMNLRGFTPSQRFKNARENIFY